MAISAARFYTCASDSVSKRPTRLVDAAARSLARPPTAWAIGDIDKYDAWRVLFHELGIGIALGGGMAVVAYFLALVWVSDPQIALTVAISILAIVLWSTSAGSLLPLFATRLKIDPTVVSGPVMSTLVDATGLLIYFSVARVVLGI